MKLRILISLATMLASASLLGCEQQPSPTGGAVQEPAQPQESAATQPAPEQPAPTQPAPAATQQESMEQQPTPEQQAALDLMIVNWGPKSTKAGTPFNVQADGASAIFFTVKQAGPGLVIMFNNQELSNTAVSQASNTVSASVPEELIANPGDIQVYVMDKASGAKSESVIFVVE